MTTTFKQLNYTDKDGDSIAMYHDLDASEEYGEETLCVAINGKNDALLPLSVLREHMGETVTKPDPKESLPEVEERDGKVYVGGGYWARIGNLVTAAEYNRYADTMVTAAAKYAALARFVEKRKSETAEREAAEKAEAELTAERDAVARELHLAAFGYSASASYYYALSASVIRSAVDMIIEARAKNKAVGE